MKPLFSLVILSTTVALPTLANTTFNNTEKFAWGANTGWISFRHEQPTSPAGVVFGGAFLSGYAYAANTGWIHFGNGSPANGHSYSNTGSDHGVNHDGAGNLTTANATSDSDGDGVSDLAEYLADTDPNDPDSYLKIVSHSHNLDVTETTLEFTTTPTRLYRIEYSDDLGQNDPWTDSALGTFVPDASSTTTKTITYPGNPRKFFRATAIVPLTP